VYLIEYIAFAYNLRKLRFLLDKFDIIERRLYDDIDNIGMDKHLCSKLLEYSHIQFVQNINLQW